VSEQYIDSITHGATIKVIAELFNGNLSWQNFNLSQVF